ncbi:hypothetical protein K2P97_11800 [bacterium]|nr:hypothetical protein [bacterium]
MKLIITLTIVLIALTSCDKLKKMEEGMDATRAGIKNTTEGLRKQKLAEASKLMLDENNRKTLSPIPSNMMSAARAMGEALLADEMLLWTKNYLIKVNEEVFTDTYPWIDEGTEEGMILKVKFTLNKMADLQMMMLVSGFLAESTLEQIVNEQAEQGAYRDVAFAILKMRADFYSDVMLEAGLIGGDKQLSSLGQIDKAIEYGEKLDYISKLDFADQIKMNITGFDEKKNESLSRPLDPKLAALKWTKILTKAQADFKAQSFSKDPAKNEAAVREYAQKYKEALEKIQAKLRAYPALPAPPAPAPTSQQ